MKYASELAKKHKFTLKESKKLFITIQLGFQFKRLNSEDVEYHSGKIHNIKGLEYKNGVYSIVNKFRNSIKTEKRDTTQQFNQSLDHFLREYNSKRLKL